MRLLQGDMREKLAELADASVDSIVTDPPYGLKFMGNGWDHGVPGIEFWTLLLRVAKPGAHLLAFGGTRTFHRLWCAVEDAGWEIRDTLMWLHGEGFPKSLDASKAIGAAAWKGWGTALKPAFEPILMARKPLIGTVAENLQAHGTGALNIDSCRVSYAGTEDAAAAAAAAAELRSKQTSRNTEGWGMKAQAKTAEDFANGPAGLGRWPANVLHDGSEEVLAAFPDAPGQQRAVGPQPRGDSGSAARFFWCPKASKQDRNEGLEGMPRKAVNWSSGEQSPGTFQSPNTERENENFHPTVKPTELMQYLCRLVTPKGGTVLDPFMGSGSTGKACEREGMSFVGIELDPVYIEIAKRRIAGVAPLFAEVA